MVPRDIEISHNELLRRAARPPRSTVHPAAARRQAPASEVKPLPSLVASPARARVCVYSRCGGGGAVARPDVDGVC